MTNLKPCPFCGGHAQVVLAAPEDNNHLLFEHYAVTCESCHVMIGTTAFGMTDFFDTVEDAANAWNRRVRPGCKWCYGTERYCPRCDDQSEKNIK